MRSLEQPQHACSNTRIDSRMPNRESLLNVWFRRCSSVVRSSPLNVGYVDTGPAEGPVVLLLHGWPYDIHSYVDVSPGWQRRVIE